MQKETNHPKHNALLCKCDKEKIRWKEIASLYVSVVDGKIMEELLPAEIIKAASIGFI